MGGELRCPLCGGAGAFETLFFSTNGYPIVRCPECRLAFTDARGAPAPSALYPEFDQHDSVALRSARSVLSVFLRQRAAVVEKHQRSGRLLDYGCGAGAFARFMARRGFEVVGLEPFSLGAPATGPNLSLVRAPLDTVRGPFDVITLWQVLEHLDAPVPVLEQLRGLLAPGGVLVVSVPNFASVQSAVFKGGWFHLDPPRHLLHFERATLLECLRRARLEVVAEAPLLLEYGTSGWVQSALNAALPRRNFLYELVKARGALTALPLAEKLGHLVASVAGAVPLLAASVPLELASSRTNTAASLTVVARPT